ncbi:hypothetical protein GPALN_005953 [Globodera pallida]|uniref:B30.2/SPRY domain-containing protein n=1 Tax=Globodera pallida TaxID=36090 RepID=A0A183BMX1_GLOPA|nr:hypothetical protein GPALN_005953 [Globodera pallida]
MRTFLFLCAVCLIVASFLQETGAWPPKTTSNNNNPGLTIGNKWNSKANSCHRDLTLSEPDQLTAQVTGENLGYRSSVFAVQPVPQINSGIFYYEVEIKGIVGAISIGLATKQMALNKEVGEFQGYAYHFGSVFLCHEAEGCSYTHNVKRPYYNKGISPYAVGNVIGCGVDLAQHKIFYTLNGQRLGPAGLLADSADPLYPCVSLSHRGDIIAANFGPDFRFKFDIAKWNLETEK